MESNAKNNRVNVGIEHLHKMKVISPSKRKKSLTPLLTNDSGERNILKGSKVDRMLNLDTTISERRIEMCMRLLTMKTLH